MSQTMAANTGNAAFRAIILQSSQSSMVEVNFSLSKKQLNLKSVFKEKLVLKLERKINWNLSDNEVRLIIIQKLQKPIGERQTQRERKRETQREKERERLGRQGVDLQIKVLPLLHLLSHNIFLERKLFYLVQYFKFFER